MPGFASQFVRRLHMLFFNQIRNETGDDLSIDKTDPDFKSTGLKESSYLLADRDVAVELDFFRRAKLIGQIEGELKRKVEEWRGEPLR